MYADIVHTHCEHTCYYNGARTHPINAVRNNTLYNPYTYRHDIVVERYVMINSYSTNTYMIREVLMYHICAPRYAVFVYRAYAPIVTHTCSCDHDV